MRSCSDTPAPDARGEAIRLDHLSFTYTGVAAPALHDVSLVVRHGEMVTIMGATGAGKTTLAKCLNRTVPSFQSGQLTGVITVLGQRLEEQGVGDLAGIVGLVSQDFEAQLFATNVVQEVAFGMEQVGVSREEMRRRLPEALHTVGLQGFEQRDPTTLSGGEKQRLALAATLALRPQILVFDEPTTDLDPAGKLEIFGVLAAMRRDGFTLVVIEHEIAAAQTADRVVILSNGRIVADDTPARVLTAVDFLEQHGVRPPDICRLGTRLGLEPLPLTLDEAEAAIRARGGIRSPPAEVNADKRLGTPSTEHRTPTSGLQESSGAGCSVSAPPSHLPTVPQAESVDTSAPPLVRAEDVEFAYETGARALNGVSLTLAAGEFLALIGQNGSGKTTFAKMLNGLLRPLRGRVLLDGRDLQTLPLNRVAHDVGYVFQNPDHQIFAGTVADEIAFGPQNFGLPAATIRARVRSALDAVGLTGYEDEDPFLLSKGHRQRLAVASLLALQPRLLILDEPTTGLDYNEQRRMMDLFATLHNQGMTLVMITHSPWVVAEYADRAVLMSQGRVCFDGSLGALFAQDALLEQSHFRAPDITTLGRRFGITPLCVEELASLVTGT